MKKHGETQADLSRATGISEALISTWKKRSATGSGLSLENAVIIAGHYGMTVEDFYKLIKEKE